MRRSVSIIVIIGVLAGVWGWFAMPSHADDSSVNDSAGIQYLVQSAPTWEVGDKPTPDTVPETSEPTPTETPEPTQTTLPTATIAEPTSTSTTPATTTPEMEPTNTPMVSPSPTPTPYVEFKGNRETITLADMGYESDETVQGVLVSRSYGLRWPEAWEPVPGSRVRLYFNHSSVLDERSTMAVDWNGTRLGSTLLNKDNETDGKLELEIPADLIQPGYNALRLYFYMWVRGNEDQICDDLDNPSLWVTIHKTTAFDLAYELAIPETDLALFPKPFIDDTDLITSSVTFIVPDDPTPTELTAVAAISAKLAQLAAWRPLVFDVVGQSDAAVALEREENVIVVGSPDRLSSPVLPTLPNLDMEGDKPVLTDDSGEVLPADAGVLWEQLSPINEHNVILYVSGNSEEGVLTAGRGLASESIYARLSGQMGIVLSVSPPDSERRQMGQMMTLEDLGYDDQTGRGSVEQIMTFVVPLPLSWQIESGATFDLHFAHSELLNAERSYLNVLLNDVPVGSIKLTPDNIDDSWSTFQLPSRLFVGGNNTLTIEAGIQVDEYYDDPYWCLEDYWGSAWLVVYADSLFKIPGGIPAELALNLNHYPYAFIGPANLSDLAFVVPANADAGIGVPIVEIIRGMGRMLQGETLYPRVITDDMALTGKDVPTHQIMVGLPSENQAIVGLNDVLPQPFREGSNEPVLVEAIGQVVPAKGAAGYLETVLDPMNAKPRMVVTGTSDKGLLWAAQILGNPRLLANAQGDLAIVDGPRQVRIYDVNPKSERLMVQPIAEQVTEVVVEPTSPWNLRLYLSVAFFVLTFAVLFVVAFTKIR